MKIIIPKDTGEHLHETEEERQWQLLVEQIYRRNVIPVIGPYWNGPDAETVGDNILSAISEDCGIEQGKCRSFFQLINSRQYRSRFDRSDSIYSLIDHILENNEIHGNESLKKFLSMPYFPFVINTTYDPLVENIMREIHGEKLKIMTFDNDARTNDDIAPNESDLAQPTLYYIFGKSNSAGRKFVVTDYDLLNFSRSWLAQTDSGSNAKPVNLAHALSKKYLLVLGCEYQSWLFKFFWYAMKDRELVSSMDTIGMMARPNTDEELIDFLTNSHTFTKDVSAAELSQTIETRIEEYIAANKPSKFDYPEKGCDVFISYSRADSETAAKLYEILTEKGLSVWYDRNDLIAGDDFLKEIRKSIRTARLFVPILSSNINRQYNEEHVYRTEWGWAVGSLSLRGNVKYLIPLCEKGFDLYDDKSAIPDSIRERNTFEYDPSNKDTSFRQFADVLFKILNEQ